MRDGTVDFDYLARLDRFAAAQVAPHAARWEAEGRSAIDAIRAACAEGLAGIDVPAEHGGLGLGFATKCAAAERLARVDFGFALALLNTQNVAQKLARSAPSEMAARIIPGILAGERIGCTAITELGAGSDVGRMATRATRIDGGWRLDGEKAWLINGRHADTVILYAQTDPALGTRGIAGFIVEASAPGFARVDNSELAAQSSIGTGGIRLDGCEVADDALFAPPGAAIRTMLDGINGARVYVGAMCVGMVAAALDIAGAYGERRVTFDKPLADHQGWRWALADCAGELAAARALVREAVAVVAAEGPAARIAAEAKLFATQMADRQLPRMLQAMGAEGLRDAYPLVRFLAAARVASFADGSSEMLRERIVTLMRKER